MRRSTVERGSREDRSWLRCSGVEKQRLVALVQSWQSRPPRLQLANSHSSGIVGVLKSLLDPDRDDLDSTGFPGGGRGHSIDKLSAYST